MSLSPSIDTPFTSIRAEGVLALEAIPDGLILPQILSASQTPGVLRLDLLIQDARVHNMVIWTPTAVHAVCDAALLARAHDAPRFYGDLYPA